MSIRLFIARHGETEYNRSGRLQGRGIDASLNESGKKQARQLAAYLKRYTPDLVASSSMARAAETAGYFCNGNGIPFVKRKALDEMDFGNLEGHLYTEAAGELEVIDSAWRRGEVTLEIPGGESPQAVFNRANADVLTMADQVREGTMMLFVHGRLIRILLAEWLGYGLKNMHLIEHQNGAVNQLMYENGVFEPVYLNKTEHLS